MKIEKLVRITLDNDLVVLLDETAGTLEIIGREYSYKDISLDDNL